MTILLGLLFVACLFHIWDEPIVSNYSAIITRVNAGFSQGKKYLNLDQVERDFCSARQAYAHAQQAEVKKKVTCTPIPKKYLEYEVSQWGVIRESTLIGTTHPGQAL